MPTFDIFRAGGPAARDAYAELENAPAAFLDLAKQSGTARDAARRWTPEQDGELTEQGIRAQRDRLLADVDRGAQAVIDDLAGRVDRAAAEIAAYTAGAGTRPEDPAADAREARAWERLRPLLDAGQAPVSVIDGVSDVDEARALRRELPAWLRLQHLGTRPQGLAGALSDAPDPAPFLRRLDYRLADVLPSADGERLRVQLEAGPLIAGARARLDAERANLAGTGSGSGLADAIGARIAEQRARAGAPAA